MIERFAGECAEAGVVIVRAGGARDGQPFGQQAVGMKTIERGEQHPLGKVAGGTEQKQFARGLSHGSPLCRRFGPARHQ